MAYAANRSDLKTLHARLSGLVEQSGTVRTRTEYDSIKALYDSTLAKYTALSETYRNVQTARKVSSYIYDIPNFKDKNQWMAGGTLRNQTFAGGNMFSTDTTPSLENEAVKGSFSTALLTGSIVSMLNKGFTDVQSKSFGGALDLIADFDVRATSVVIYQLIVTMSDGQEFSLQAGSYTSGGSGGNGMNVATTSGPMNLDAIREAYENRIDLVNITPISFGIKIASDVFSGTLGTDSLASYVAGAAIGTIQSKINSHIASMAVKALNITSVPATIGITLAVSSVVGELSEMALGIDNQFGYGGTYVGTDVYGQAHYAEVEGNFIERSVQHMKDQIGELMGTITGDGYASAAEKAEARALGSMRNAAIEAKSSFSASMSLKAAEELAAINASIGENRENMGLSNQDSSLSTGDFKQLEREMGLDGVDSYDSGGFFSTVGDFFSGLFDFLGDDDDAAYSSGDSLSTGNFKELEREMGLDEVDYGDDDYDDWGGDHDDDYGGWGGGSWGDYDDGYDDYDAGWW